MTSLFRKTPATSSPHVDNTDRLLLTPRDRVDFMLARIEETSQQTLSLTEQGIEARKAKSQRALKNYRQILSVKAKTFAEETRCEKAARIFVNASNAVRPKQWFAARTVLTEVERLRKSLSSAKAEEAVEAALYAMDAAQRLEGLVLEKRADVGEKVLANLSKAGQLRAGMLARKNAGRNADIRHRAKQMKEYDGASNGEIVHALADRFTLSARQIRRVLAKVDTC